MQAIHNVHVTYKVKLLKYEEGKDPNIDAPFDTVEHEVTLTGQEALNLIQQLKENGVDVAHERRT